MEVEGEKLHQILHDLGDQKRESLGKFSSNGKGKGGLLPSILKIQGEKQERQRSDTRGKKEENSSKRRGSAGGREMPSKKGGEKIAPVSSHQRMDSHARWKGKRGDSTSNE